MTWNQTRARQAALTWLGSGLLLANPLSSPLRAADSPSTDLNRSEWGLSAVGHDPDGGFRLLASVPAGASASVKATADFIQWRQVAAVTGSDTPREVVDASAAGQARSFYRLGQDAAMFRGDLSHSGVYRTRGVPALPSLRWKFPTAGPVYSSPVLANGLLYLGGTDTNFYALNAETGTEVWRFETGGAIRSTAAIAAGTAYFGGRGGLLWKFPTRRAARSTPAVVDGVVYVGGVDGYLYALDAVTGTNRWKFKTQGNSDFPAGEIYHAPAVANGVVYFGSRDYALYAVDALTGKRKWRHEYAGTWAYNSPAVADGVVYAGTSMNGYLSALDALTGKQKWQFNITVEEYSSPAIVDGIAYFGGGDCLPFDAHNNLKLLPDYLHAVDAATGKEKWRFRVGGQVFSSPLVDNGTIYFGCVDGNVYALR